MGQLGIWDQVPNGFRNPYIRKELLPAFQQDVQGHEKAVFQQLEKLRTQDTAQSMKTASPVLSAKPQTVVNAEVSTQCSCSVEHKQDPGLGEVVKMELENVLNQRGTDVLCLNKPITQADQLWGRDVEICDDEERDLCSGFNTTDINLSYEDYEGIFACTKAPTAAICVGCPSIDQDRAAAGDPEESPMQSVPETELVKPSDDDDHSNFRSQ